MPRSALVLVDVQYDFLPGGALAVADGDQILARAYRLLDEANFDLVIASQDYHPQGHVSFASRWGKEPFSVFRVPDFGEGEKDQEMWPEHCVQGTRGAQIEEGVQSRLNTLGESVTVIKKGQNKDEDAYSAFNTRADGADSSHSLAAKALKDASITDVFVLGLATDYCVRATVLAALAEAVGASSPWKVHVVKEACRGVDKEKSKHTLQELEKAGAKLISIDGDELQPHWK